MWRAAKSHMLTNEAWRSTLAQITTLPSFVNNVLLEPTISKFLACVVPRQPMYSLLLACPVSRRVGQDMLGMPCLVVRTLKVSGH